MRTLDGVPIATYGLTGFMIIALAGLTFIDRKGEQSDVANVVATASVPAFMGTVLTPTAPSFLDTAMTVTAESVVGKKEEPSMFAGPSILGSPFAENNTAAAAEPSILGSPFVENNTVEPPSIAEKAISSVTEETSKLTDFMQNREEQEEPTPIAKFGGKNKKKNKTRRRK